MNLFRRKAEVIKAVVQTAEGPDDASQAATPGVQHVTLEAVSPPLQPSGASAPAASGGDIAAAVAAERKRISSIVAVAAAGQEEMRDKFIADGTETLAAVMSLCEDAKKHPAPKADAAEMLKQLSGISVNVQTSSQQDKDIVAEYKAIGNLEEAQAFYMAHRDELKNVKLNPKQEG
jgi:hypothetical protein